MSKRTPKCLLSIMLVCMLLLLTICIPVSADSDVSSTLGEDNLDIYHSAVARGKANPEQPLEIITYPAGDNQPTHPKVLYFPEGWNGHKYWMAYTPYPDNNDYEENPCITYSDDGIHWSEEGISNPIIRTEYDSCWYSDVHLIYVPEMDTMELWVRWCSPNGEDGKEPGWEGVFRLKSQDGVNWSEKEYLYHTVDQEFASLLSPSVVYDEGKYKIWFCHQRNRLRYFESEDGTNWEYIRDISVNLTPLGNYKLWHFDMIKTDKGYEFVGCYQYNGEFDRNNYIAYSWSEDNVHFEPAVCILANGEPGSFDDLELYRPSLVQVGNKYRLYYGAQKDIRIWHIGMTEAPSMEDLHELLKANTAEELPSYAVDTQSDAEDAEANLIVKILSKLWEHKKYVAAGFFAGAIMMGAAAYLVCRYQRKKK